MHDVRQFVESLVPFLAILNPFALCLYLVGVMDDLESRDFVHVVVYASIISLIVFCLFAQAGEPFLIGVLGIKPEALRVFGGVIFFIIAYNYVTRGYRAATVLRGSLEELPSAIALPFMIGAGTITEAILLGKKLSPIGSVFVLLVAMVASIIVVLAFKVVRDRLKAAQEKLLDRYVNILARVNGLLIGAISTEMVLTGTRQLWLQG